MRPAMCFGDSQISHQMCNLLWLHTTMVLKGLSVSMSKNAKSAAQPAVKPAVSVEIHSQAWRKPVENWEYLSGNISKIELNKPTLFRICLSWFDCTHYDPDDITLLLFRL
jgi:hypothetical protein